jgi:ubiquinone/menaquinone biosynthesis C-methylase UbiE
MRQNLFRKFFRFNQYERDQWIAKTVKNIPNGSKVLDVGAGSCPYRELFKHCEYKTHDFAQLRDDQLLGKEYGKIDYVSDIKTIPVPDNSFDVIICTEVFEHIPEPIPVVTEFSRILKSGGKLILTAPLQSGIHQEPYHFYGGYTPFWYEKFLSENAFQNIVIEENGRFNQFYSQESIRFIRKNHPFSNIVSLLYTPIWLTLVPIVIVNALLAPLLDKFDSEKRFTIGYHVLAHKSRISTTSQNENNT